MDELTMLHTARDLPPTTLDDLSRSRIALDRAIAGAHPRTHARARVHRRAGWAFAAVGVAATLAIGLVATNVTGFGGTQQGASAQAAELLTAAADTTIHTSDPVVGPNQYLRVDTKAIEGQMTSDAKGTVIGFLTQRTSSLYIPKSDQRNWVFLRSLPVTFQTFGAASQAYATKAQAAMFAEHGTAGEYYQGLNGNFQGRPDYTPASLATLPRDPKQLLAHFYSVEPGSGVSNDGKTFNLIIDVLTTGFVPADLRAALYKAAALIPGVSVTEKDATMDGRTGMSIGRTETKTSIRHDIIIDPTNGLVIGQRMILLTGDEGYPAGTAIGSTSVTTTVVDAAPDRAQSK
jgi:hypothetical protein